MRNVAMSADPRTVGPCRPKRSTKGHRPSRFSTPPRAPWQCIGVMLQDRYGFALSTASPEARDAYVAGVDLSLSANHGAEEQFRRAIALDDGLAVAHAALARTLQVAGRIPDAKIAAAR